MPIVIWGFSVAPVIAESERQQYSDTDTAPGITPGRQGGYDSDFLRPQFEHERNREFTDRDFGERGMRDYDGFGEDMDQRRTSPRSTPEFERSWESLDDDYRWDY